MFSKTVKQTILKERKSFSLYKNGNNSLMFKLNKAT